MDSLHHSESNLFVSSGQVQERSYRDQSYNGMFPMASFDDHVAVALNCSNPRTIGIYPETKIPKFYNAWLAQHSHNTTMENLIVAALRKHGYNSSSSPCFVQSFDEDSVKSMSMMSPLPMVFLTNTAIPNSTLARLARFCYGIGLRKDVVVEVVNNRIARKTNFIARVKSYGMKVIFSYFACVSIWKTAFQY